MFIGWLKLPARQWRGGKRVGWQTTKNLAVISRPSGLWTRQFPRLPLPRAVDVARFMCASLTRARQQPSTLSRTSFAALLGRLSPSSGTPLSSSNTLAAASTSVQLRARPPSVPRPFIFRASSFSSAFLPRPDWKSAPYNRRAESFRLEISTRMPFRRTALSYSHPTSPRSLFSLSLQPAVFPAISSPCLDPSQPPDARIDREKEDFAGNKFFGDSLSFRLAEPTTTTPEEYFTPAGGEEEEKPRVWECAWWKY